MNSVHEPGPNGDSETIPSRKIRSKTKPMNEHPAGPAGTPRCALARPGARMATRGRSYRGRVPVVSWPGTGRIAGAGRSIVGAWPGRVAGAGCAPAQSYRGRGPRPCCRAQCRVAARPRPYSGRERTPCLRPACPAA